MKQPLHIVAAAALIGVSGCSHAPATEDMTPEDTMTQAEDMARAEAPAAPLTAGATIEARSGSSLSGEATFTEENGATKIVVSVRGAPPGPHAVHIHEVGDCSSPDGKSAGPHFNPDGHDHGGPMSEMHHAGDLGNMEAAEDGTGTLEIVSNDLTVADGARSVAGRALIIHEKPDDFVTQPTGAAGARIGCGEIAR